MSNTFEPLNKPDSTIQDAGLYQGQVLFTNTVYFKHTKREAFISHKLFGHPEIYWGPIGSHFFFLTHIFLVLAGHLTITSVSLFELEYKKKKVFIKKK